jgi:hypothetical protein
MHVLWLGSPVTIETDPEYAEYDLYDVKAGVFRCRDRDWDVIGLWPGRPVLNGPDGEQLALDVEGQAVSVIKDGHAVWSSAYENFSGDWAAATYSPDGRFIVLGCPYGFDFRIWERV